MKTWLFFKMNSSYTLAELIHGFTEKGEAFDAGCKKAQVKEMITHCKTINYNKNICIVRAWQWWDLELENEAKEALKKDGRLPCVVKSDHIIEDYACRFNPGDWVRTSLLLKFHHNCIFETQNTFYILVGEGTRKSILTDIAMAMF